MEMTSRVLVTGGTGTLGRQVIPRLRDAGPGVRVLSRGRHESVDGIEYVTGDLLKDEGIEPAVDEVESVLHLAGDAKGDDEATRNLVRVASKAGVKHLVYISVIGADRVPLGYFRSKWAAERAVAESGLPWTTLRAAQFHDFVLDLAQKMAKLPVLRAPPAVRGQPVDAGEVADRLVELALAAPSGLAPDLPGQRCTRCPSCFADTSGLGAAAARSCRSRFRGRSVARTGPARTCLRKGERAGPGRSFWPIG